MQPLEGVEDSLALLGVAGGRIGAIKSLEQLRAVCAHTGAMVVPGSVSVAGVLSLLFWLWMVRALKSQDLEAKP